ncbi:MAG: hypothetical protein P4L46_25980 [Fimbriimonas sp.]|nr:hypothetical protein [Fimbriimonas sp.]
MKSETVYGRKSFGISSDRVTAWITETGGHVAPVTFKIGDRAVEPLSIAPWFEETHEIAPILQVLRGDFFCAPFGGNDAPYGPEQHPIHGETANRDWQFVSGNENSVEMSLNTTIRPGTVRKQVWTVEGQTALYQRHTIAGMTGPMCLGHHAMVKFRTEGNISLSPFDFGQVFPGQFENPVEGGYSSLKAGARFSNLKEVPSNDGTTSDLSVYPAREGFEDLVMVYALKGSDFAWTAVTFPSEGYIWFTLKDPRVLSGTILWHSNGGRHYAPWSSRHRGVLGLEEVTSYMHYGLAGSVAENDGSIAGYRTFFDLSPDQPLVVNTIMGVAPCGANARTVVQIGRTAQGIQIATDEGQVIDVELDVESLYAS